MKSIFITGAGGFIGSHLSASLSGKYSIDALLRYNSRHDRGMLEYQEAENEINIRFGDITDYHMIEAMTAKSDCIIHLASLIGIPYSYNAPLSYIRNNIEGTFNILMAARRNNVSHVIVVSSSEVYGTNSKIPLKEEYALKPQSPYAATKVSAEALAMSYYYSFDTPVTVLRPFNTYGPGQSLRAIIPTVIIQALRGNTIELGRTDVKRDFNYISDTVDGIAKTILNTNAIGRIINIGSGAMHSVGDIIEEISHIKGSNLTVKHDRDRVRPSSSEVEHLLADISLADKLLGYEPRYTLKQGLEETYRWFDKHQYRWNNKHSYME
ncbi:MAG: GDP-mannose 4,6-dehydratase [candidate division WOR-3 bacterium]|nr:GDP-mannose 4,6-dehydratase [candidate division WOR-3 bacterium]